MARIHRNIVYGAVGVFGLGTALAYAFPEAFGLLGFGGKEPAITAPAPAFEVKVGQEPEKPKPQPAPQKEERIAAVVQEVKKEKPSGGTKKAPPPSLTDAFFKRVNQGEMLTFGKEIESKEGGFSDGSCSTLQPVRVRAMIADNATTDQPGLAIGMTTEPIQGEESDGTYCIAIPAGSVVGFMVAQAGEYATNRANVQVEAMWLPDGTELKVGQPAKHVDGVPGVVGEANHHVFSKTFAMIGAIAFRGFDNITSIGQFSTGQATDPIQDAISKRFNRPSEISFTSGNAVEFDLMPVTTPGY